MIKSDIKNGTIVLFSSTNPLSLNLYWDENACSKRRTSGIVKIEFIETYKNMDTYFICDLHYMSGEIKRKYICQTASTIIDITNHNGIVKND
jgi:hypothetical protein